MKLEKILNLIEPPISGEWGIDVSELSKNVAKVIRTTNFTNIGKIDYAKEVVLREIEEKKILNKKLLYGDIIVEKSGGSPTQPVGRVVYFDLDTDENYLCNNFTSVLRPKNDKVHSKYLFWMLFYQHLSKKTLNFQNKTTGIINLKLDRYVKEIQIPLPPLDIQKKIADTLDKAQELIDKRKEQISALDKFLENLFLDMFGDPVSNPMGWEKKTLDILSNKITDGTHDSPERLKQGIKFITGKHIRPYIIDYENSDYVLEEIHKVIFSRCNPEYLDILYTNIGVNLGTAAINKVKYEFSMKNVALLKYNRDMLNGYFLQSLLNNYLFVSKIRNIASIGGAQSFLSLKQIKELLIIVPPLDLQNQFAYIVEKVEAEKTKLEASLKEMEDNFNSIMQRAFKGQLF